MINLITKFFIFILGASIGSFLNVLIDRLPRNESINGRSHCDYCKKKITWYDMFPVLSFFILGGKTRCCGKKMSWQYPLIEILTGISFLIIWTFSFSPIILSTAVCKIIILGIVSCLIIIFVSDLKYHLISDYILLVLFVLSFLLKFVIPAKAGIQSDIVSALVVSLPIFLIYYFSKERAMGLGDVYLTGIIGFLLGWRIGFLALYVAFVTGAIVGVLLILLQRKKIKSKIAFGPFLVIGMVVMMFWGEKIMEIVKRMYGL